jgi:hypothetical protein
MFVSLGCAPSRLSGSRGVRARGERARCRRSSSASQSPTCCSGLAGLESPPPPGRSLCGDEWARRQRERETVGEARWETQ